ncbi:MAG TPA: hypothetical protein EYH26_01725 [Pyrodictium sp.]|nr:hypothetical protein [Pyrodictium sp.]HIQ55082.1 hypothetical protein [Pyrodictium sp.]
MSTPSKERTIFSVRIRRGPDIKHYDLYFGDDGLHFLYLGEYWERLRPKTGLQQRMDMLIYSLKKKRRRQGGEKRVEDFTIPYNDIKEYVLEWNVEECRLTLHTKQGVIEIRFSPKVYELVKKLIKKYVELHASGRIVRRAR